MCGAHWPVALKLLIYTHHANRALRIANEFNFSLIWAHIRSEAPRCRRCWPIDGFNAIVVGRYSITPNR